MTDLITASFVVTKAQKTCLEQWAREDDRSVSYILRDILDKECDRRAAGTPKNQPTKRQPSQ